MEQFLAVPHGLMVHDSSSERLPLHGFPFGVFGYIFGADRFRKRTPLPQSSEHLLQALHGFKVQSFISSLLQGCVSVSGPVQLAQLPLPKALSNVRERIFCANESDSSQMLHSDQVPIVQSFVSGMQPFFMAFGLFFVVRVGPLQLAPHSFAHFCTVLCL
jgi:hypothetical protein